MLGKETEIRDLLHYANDHFISALFLFDHNMLHYPEDPKIYITYDSAAYLAHLGIEQILKACILFEDNEFEFDHNILVLIKEISFLSKTLTEDTLNLINELSCFEFARYPRSNKFPGIETGETDRTKVVKLYDLIINNMPDDLYNIYATVGVPKDYIRKGDRILMKRKEQDPSS